MAWYLLRETGIIWKSLPFLRESNPSIRKRDEMETYGGKLL